MKTTKNKKSFTESFHEVESLVTENESISNSLDIIDEFIYKEKCANHKDLDMCMSIVLDGKEYFLYDIFDKIKDVIANTSDRELRFAQKELIEIVKGK